MCMPSMARDPPPKQQLNAYITQYVSKPNSIEFSCDKFVWMNSSRRRIIVRSKPIESASVCILQWFCISFGRINVGILRFFIYSANINCSKTWYAERNFLFPSIDKLLIWGVERWERSSDARKFSTWFEIQLTSDDKNWITRVENYFFFSP